MIPRPPQADQDRPLTFDFRFMYLDQFYSLYYQFLNYFPAAWHGAISLILAILLIYAIFKVIKKNFVFIILIVLLLPQAKPMLTTIWQNVLEILKFLIKR